MEHDVADATILVPSCRTMFPPACIGHHLERVSHSSSEGDEQLPPYECVSDEEFDAMVRETQRCTGSECTCSSPNHEQPTLSSECLSKAANHDFILLPSDSERTSEYESTVVSCFLDDRSYDSSFTGALSHDVRARGSTTSEKSSTYLTLGPCCPGDCQHERRSRDLIADWVFEVALNVGRTLLKEVPLRERASVADLDKKLGDRSSRTAPFQFGKSEFSILKAVAVQPPKDHI